MFPAFPALLVLTFYPLFSVPSATANLNPCSPIFPIALEALLMLSFREVFSHLSTPMPNWKSSFLPLYFTENIYTFLMPPVFLHCIISIFIMSDLLECSNHRFENLMSHSFLQPYYMLGHNDL